MLNIHEFLTINYIFITVIVILTTLTISQPINVKNVTPLNVELSCL